jgi:rubrerythrin
MKIKIKKSAPVIYRKGLNKRPTDGYSKRELEWIDTLKKVSGKTIEVETDYLFNNQFNTAPIKGVSERGLRIMENLVEEVIDDERIGKYKCNWCGGYSEKKDKCPNCGKAKYLKPLF